MSTWRLATSIRRRSIALSAANPVAGRERLLSEGPPGAGPLRLPKEMENLAADLAVDGIHGWGRLYDRISARFASA